MTIGRRGFLHLLGRAGGLITAMLFWPPARRALAATPLAVRAVEAHDATALRAIMASSVADADAFHGKCGEWSLAWARDLITRCPDSVVLSAGPTPIAFMEIPPIRPLPPPLAKGATAEEREGYAVRVRNRMTFRVTAAGVRDDLLPREESVRVFLALLQEAFGRARALGYAYVEAVAPWERHPRMARKWTDYPGCELAEPVSYSQDGGADAYWLRWKLDEAVAALAAERAGRVG